MYVLTTINSRVYNENLDEWKAIESGLAVMKKQKHKHSVVFLWNVLK